MKRKPTTQNRNQNILMHSSHKITVCKENLPKWINSLIDICHWASGSTSHCSEVAVELPFKHLSI